MNPLDESADMEIFVAALSRDTGDRVWFQSMGGTGNQQLTDLHAMNDRLYFTGWADKLLAYEGGSATTQGTGAVMAKLGTNGTVLSAKLFGTSAYGNSISATPFLVGITGQNSVTLDFDGGTLPSSPPGDVLLAVLPSTDFDK
jgi:hypothetical protein